jgi:hypothetical protein
VAPDYSPAEHSPGFFAGVVEHLACTAHRRLPCVKVRDDGLRAQLEEPPAVRGGSRVAGTRDPSPLFPAPPPLAARPPRPSAIVSFSHRHRVLSSAAISSSAALPRELMFLGGYTVARRSNRWPAGGCVAGTLPCGIRMGTFRSRTGPNARTCHGRPRFYYDGEFVSCSC